MNTAVIGGTGGITGNRANSLFIGTGGITRASGSAVWEDGNCGNSSQLWFTPADFLCYGLQDVLGGLVAASAAGITDTGAPGYSKVGVSGGGGRSLNGPGLVNNVTGDGQCVAMKLLPKGFQTLESSTFYFATGYAAPSWATSLEVYSTELSADTYIKLGPSGAVSGAAGGVPVILDMASAIGIGSTAIVVVVNQNAGIRANEALIGVSVDIARV